MAEQYTDRDNIWAICRKILQNLAGIADGTFTVNFTPGAGSAVVTGATATIAVTGTAVPTAITAGKKGYLSAAIGNSDSGVFVGSSTVTNGGASRGLMLTQAGTSPMLTGPVYINGTAGDVVGVILV